MKISALLSVLLMCLLPVVTFAVVKPQPAEVTPETTVPELLASDKSHAGHKVTVLQDSALLEMELEEYIVCVVLAEMPADFEPEALKAQAVVARTYTCRSMGNSKHETADVCTDFACCQAYISCDDYIESGGTEALITKVRTAVEDTRGQVLRYEGELIEATYFSCSGGRTEDAEAVWGTDVPYLQSVDSPGEEKATHYTDSVSIPIGDFCSAVGITAEDFRLYGIGGISYTEGGGVAAISLGGVTFSGTRIRQKLNLRSTAFVISCTGSSVLITTKGFGHRVGMSQYGAEAMAVQGSDYQHILSHYYQGTQLSDYFG